MEMTKVADHKIRISDAEDRAEQFKLQANAKAFKILADGIYQNKIKAIIRELSTNARDAHIAAGHNKPPHVHLPKQHMPVFSIEDFGVGLSPEQIKKIYSHFFASDKEDSNDFIGCLGLGSKTPFCYNTRSYNVESWYDGTHYIYNCFINDRGIPSIIKLSSKPTTRENGVKVSFPVATNDIYEFANTAKQVYKFFEVQPKMVGEQILIPPIVRHFDGPDWSLTNEASYVLMGSIAYPINMSIPGLDTSMRAFNIEFRLGIGDVEIDSSREGLSYTKKTIATLNNKFAEIKQTIAQKVEDDLKSAKSLYQATRLRTKYNGLFKGLINHLPLKWNGKPIVNQDWQMNQLLPGKINFIEYYTYYNDKIRQASVYSINCNKEIVIDDMDTTGVVRAKQYVTARSATKHTDSNIVYIRFPSIDTDRKIYEKELDQLLNKLGAVKEDLTYTSNLPYTKPSVAAGKTPAVRLCEFMLYNNGAGFAKDVWQPVKTNPTSGLYVVRKGYQIFDEKDVIKSYNSLAFRLEQLAKLDPKLKIGDIYGVRKSDVKDLDPKDWQYVWDYVNQKTANIKNTWYDLAVKKFANNKGLNGLEPKNRKQIEYLKLLKLNPKHEISILTEKIAKIMAETVVDYQYCMTVLSVFGVKDVDPDLDVLKELELLVKKYPLLEWLGNCGVNFPTTELERHITAVDKGI